MNSRRIAADELPGLLGLYAILHPDDPIVDAKTPEVRQLWQRILADPNLRYYVAEQDGKVISTCTLTIIPNLTRRLRPYGVIENVVTNPAYRKRGFATEVLRFALDDAWLNGCYKVMLASGSKEEATWRFYEKAGFARDVKTSFIAYPSSTKSD
ncbi:MAG TPA: GNAT family N-acetyltransferase [Lacunisphaera sp.]|jgi:RimJ/RimL family protein N-acetyltransferase